MPRHELPLLIAGPMLRHVEPSTLTLWFVTSKKTTSKALIFDADNREIESSTKDHHSWQVGERCFINCLITRLNDEQFEHKQRYFYDLHLMVEEEVVHASQLCPTMLYKNQPAFSFVFSTKIHNLLHGSCRKAHFQGKDSLPELANLISPTANPDTRPDMVIFTGDQVYVDDVAGPMLVAIQECTILLGLFHEEISESSIENSQQLFGHPNCFYERSQLLPDMNANEELEKVFIKGKRKPVFTSVYADNHLIALNEIIALYLLSWSSRLWQFIAIRQPDLKQEQQTRFAAEHADIKEFTKDLPQVEKALAHIPSYMIFDDHDVTDDWNLTRAWEQQVYGNAYSKRIIGNALAAYFLCQGIGNPQEKLTKLIESANHCFAPEGIINHNQFIDDLLAFDQWNYCLDTQPPIQVLDTRTQRWRSESKATKPSGLMDWEGLCELQQQVLGERSVIIVSAAPIFGVKFIEAIQRIFTYFGAALLVDAENWMAHKGTASVILNIFCHQKTPPNFIVLSGDVHYSFVYDVALRFRRNSPRILQFTCSGIHNEFPNKLLRWFDRLNHIFYSHRSPLNFLTQRRKMQIKQRTPIGFKGDLVNKCAMGLLQLNEDGTERDCKLVFSDGDIMSFKKHE